MPPNAFSGLKISRTFIWGWGSAPDIADLLAGFREGQVESRRRKKKERKREGKGEGEGVIAPYLYLFSPLRALMTDDSLEISWQCAAIYYRLKLLSCFEDSIIRLVFSSIYLELSLSQQSTSPPNTTHQSMYPVVSLQPFRNVLFTLPHSQVNQLQQEIQQLTLVLTFTVQLSVELTGNKSFVFMSTVISNQHNLDQQQSNKRSVSSNMIHGHLSLL